MLITSTSNRRVRLLRELIREGRPDPAGRVPVEGVKLILEAVKSRLAVDELYVVTQNLGRPPIDELVRDVAPSEVFAISRKAFQSIADTETPQGVIALVRWPQFRLSDVLHSTSLLLLAHQLQDPGNMGTLIRSAEAFGVNAVLLTPHTVSCCNQKVIRASAGSLFRLPTISDLSPEKLIADLDRKRIRLVAATPDGSIDFRDLDYRKGTALVVGNEGSGISDKLLNQLRLRVKVPLCHPVESLNVAVAASIILSEAARQRSRQ